MIHTVPGQGHGHIREASACVHRDVGYGEDFLRCCVGGKPFRACRASDSRCLGCGLELLWIHGEFSSDIPKANSILERRHTRDEAWRMRRPGNGAGAWKEESRRGWRGTNKSPED